MENTKKKMSNRSFRLIVIPIITTLTLIAFLAGTLMPTFSVQMDQFLGRGERLDDGAVKPVFYERYTNDAAEAQEYGETVSKKITDEGTILLKNNGLLPMAENTKVTLFGFGNTDAGFVVGGLFAADHTIFPNDAFSRYFDVNTTVMDAMNRATVEVNYGAPNTVMSEPQTAMGNNRSDNRLIYEFNSSIYAGTESSCAGTVGIVTISRGGNEGNDMKHDAYIDGTPHQLALTQNEKEMIRFAKENCTNVIAIINADNVMEIADLQADDGDLSVDAIVWAGQPGSRGFLSVAEVLCGKLNPSGRTPDLYPVDLMKDPSYQNFGEFLYSNIEVSDPNSGLKTPRAFVEYEEGIYIGYRYYETRAAHYNGAVAAIGEVEYTGDNAGEEWYNASVIYPFGYGLSYTTFAQEITSFDASGDTVDVTVEVKNTGDMAGKEVVQLYFSAPYTAEDQRDKVEKAEWVLFAFDKTDIIEPGSSQTMSFSVPKDELASYNFMHDNGDGTTGCYMLTGGEYTVALKENSHDIWTVDGTAQTETFSVPSTIYYSGDNLRSVEKNGQSGLDENGKPNGVPEKTISDPSAQFVAATNHFEELNNYMFEGKVTNLSRTDFKGTFPTAPTENDRKASDYAVSIVTDDFDVENDALLGNHPDSVVYTTEMPESKAQNGLLLSNLRGRSYYDALWEDLLDQIDYDSPELLSCLFQGAYQIGRLSSIGIPKVTAHDGPQNLTESISRSGHCVFPTEVVISATWNEDLAYEMADAITQECLVWEYAGWYGPAVNTHRTPFCGRNFEYYSEDPLLAGKLAAAQCNAAGKNGVFVELKHFALNEMETNRGHVATWASEQAVREIYLRAFQIPLTESVSELKYVDDEGNLTATYIRGAMGIMAGQNFIGGSTCWHHYGLLTGIVRNEWGFNGIIETDMCNSQLNWQKDKFLRAGGDVWMMTTPITPVDMTSATAVTTMRNAVHHVAYVIANSMELDGAVPGAAVRYATSPWRVVLNWSIGAVAVITVVGAACVILRALDEKKNPNKYKSSNY